jgi:hypothetical protein
MTLELSLRPNTRLRLEVAWPTHPTVTAKRGQPSKAKNAGKPLPWLSMNVIQGMLYVPPGEVAKAFSRQLVQKYKRAWHEAARAAATDQEAFQLQHAVVIEIRLHRTHASTMDPGAIVEGVKPLVDGLVEAGVLQGDGPHWVAYDHRSRAYHCPKGEQRVELIMRRAA